VPGQDRGDKESVLDWEKSKLDGFFDTKDFFESHVHNGEKGLSAYLVWLRIRLIEIHRILSPTGAFYIHLDYHAAHYVKVILDEIFGYKNFRSEIIWKRKNGKNSPGEAKNYSSNVDIILYYTKSKDEFTFNPQYGALDPEYVKRAYRYDDQDGKGPYRLGPLSKLSHAPHACFDWRGYKAPKNGWRWTRERLEKAFKDGRLKLPKDKDGQVNQKQYLNEMKGNSLSNIWDDIAMVNRVSNEATGWPTQKPVALLERIISVSSNEGDMIFDCFAGCGTAMHASHNLKRKWVGVDVSTTAMKVNKKRLEELNAKVTIVDEKELEIIKEYSKKAS
jgi:site-specific DNA-methyltransferase (adenine-specific)